MQWIRLCGPTYPRDGRVKGVSTTNAQSSTPRICGCFPATQQKLQVPYAAPPRCRLLAMDVPYHAIGHPCAAMDALYHAIGHFDADILPDRKQQTRTTD